MSADRLVILDGEADTTGVVEFERTRRDLVRRGIAVGGTVLAAASIPTLLRTRNAFAQAAKEDLGIVTSAIGIEQTAVFVYRTAAGEILRDEEARRLAESFQAQEQEHLDALTAVAKRLGGSVPTGPARVSDVPGLGDLRTTQDVLRFAIELETMGVAAYYDAQRKLKDAQLLQTGASIMANEGQHLVVLRQALDVNPVPNAFETGAA